MRKNSMPRTILLADDSPTIRRLVTQTFSDANFRIVEVNNGDAAIKAIDEVRPSVVLADIYMPGKNGYEVCAYIRNHPHLSKTPVVLLVGAFDAFDENAAKESGATASITKPFEPAALIDLVHSVVLPETEEVEPQPVVQVEEPVPEPVAASVGAPVAAAAAQQADTESEDLLGLHSIFQDERPAAPAGAFTEEVINRIADRVIQRISKQVVERVAWDIVPDMAEKIVREELKRSNES